jgi:hypothetical protein
MGNRSKRYPVEVRERAVRLVFEHRREYPDEWAAIVSIQVAAEGTTNYDPKAMWLATEYVPPAASQTVDGKRDWGTRVFEVPTG